MEEIIEKIYQEISKSKQLNPVLQEKLKLACRKAVLENPTLGYESWLYAARIYLNFIVDFPHLELGPVVPPPE